VKGNWSWKNITLVISPDDMQTVTFANVKAEDISDKLTLRIASINGASAQTVAQNGVLQIRAVTEKEFDNWRIFTFSKCVITKWINDNRRDLFIPGTIWGDPVSISSNAFYMSKFSSVTIGNGVTGIGDGAFSQCTNLVNVTFEGIIPYSGFGNSAFPGDLREKFFLFDVNNGIPGDYKRAWGGRNWTRILTP
jgi:hypothetical protein